MCDGFRFLRGAAIQGCENWLSLIAALQAAEKLEDSRFLSRTHASYRGLTLRIRVCLQAYRKSLKMVPALAAAVTAVP
jgi:hypothetical protein